ncbi:MAG: DUF1858 domain-containing protein [Bacteroidales bacterium]|nr:DUF1858 domain-containing protein [Bacteroidales bacterium]
METEKLIITPKTKVHDLLSAYPELESLLIEMAPVFKKLQNPVLRRTIARVTTLQHAAIVGEIPVHSLVNALRNRVGQDILEGIESVPGRSDKQPSWFNRERIVKQLDARPIIEQGGHPLGDVLTDIRGLKAGDIYELITPFLPAPLIERVVDQGFDAWSKKEAEDIIRTYFYKKG